MATQPNYSDPNSSGQYYIYGGQPQLRQWQYDPWGIGAGLYDNNQGVSPGYSNNTGVSPTHAAASFGVPAGTSWSALAGLLGGQQQQASQQSSNLGFQPTSAQQPGALPQPGPGASMQDMLAYYFQQVKLGNPVPSQISPWQQGYGGGSPFAYDPRYFHQNAVAPYMDQNWMDYFTTPGNSPWTNPPAANPNYPGPPNRQTTTTPGPSINRPPGSAQPPAGGAPAGGGGQFTFSQLADALLAINPQWGDTARQLRSHLPGQQLTLEQLRAQMPQFSRQHGSTAGLIEQALAALGGGR